MRRYLGARVGAFLGLVEALGRGGDPAGAAAQTAAFGVYLMVARDRLLPRLRALLGEAGRIPPSEDGSVYESVDEGSATTLQSPASAYHSPASEAALRASAEEDEDGMPALEDNPAAEPAVMQPNRAFLPDAYHMRTVLEEPPARLETSIGSGSYGSVLYPAPADDDMMDLGDATLFFGYTEPTGIFANFPPALRRTPGSGPDPAMVFKVFMPRHGMGEAVSEGRHEWAVGEMLRGGEDRVALPLGSDWIQLARLPADAAHRLSERVRDALLMYPMPGLYYPFVGKTWQDMRPTARELLGMFGDALRAVAFLQDRGVCHRDIKPNNLAYLDKRTRLIDLGLAVRLDKVFEDMFLATQPHPYYPPEVRFPTCLGPLQFPDRVPPLCSTSCSPSPG